MQFWRWKSIVGSGCLYVEVRSWHVQLDPLVVMVGGGLRAKLKGEWEGYVDLRYNYLDNGVVIVFCLDTFFVPQVLSTLSVKVN